MAHEHSHTHGGQSKKQLLIVFGITAVYLAIEVVAGIWTGSLALLADAGHMFSDLGGTGLALFAIWFAQRPATKRKTYGYYRIEILAALVNATMLLFISVFILYEAWRRFQNPQAVMEWPMFWVAVVGLVLNLFSMKLLAHGSAKSLNVRGAYLEVMSDMISSIGVIVASLVMITTKWYWADPLISAGIGLFILPRTWILINQTLHVLMEGTPAHIDLKLVENVMREVSGVKAVHDLHVWTITSGVESMSSHVTIQEPSQGDRILNELQQALKEKFQIEHTTIQVEIEGCQKDDSNRCFPG